MEDSSVPPNLPSPTAAVAIPPVAASSDEFLAIIERAARDPTVDLDKFERLMAMREKLDERRAKAAFDQAIALAKGEIPAIVKNRKVDYTSPKGRTSYAYEDFAAVASAVDPVLARHGLSYRFRADQIEHKLRVTCRLSHASGYGEDVSLEADNDLSGNKNTIQAVGSAATYLQRYTLKLGLGLAAAMDDDSQSVSVDDPPIDFDQLAYLEQQLKAAGRTIESFEKWAGCPIRDTKVSRYKAGLAFLAKAKE